MMIVNHVIHLNIMAKQTIVILVLVSLIIYRATVQSTNTESHIVESMIYSDTGVQLEYYPNGFPKIAMEEVKPGITRTTEWYPDGVIRSRELRTKHCGAPFYIEEWYQNGIKKKEEFFYRYLCSIDSSFFGFIDKDSFALHVFSIEDVSTFTCPSPSTGRDTSISLIGIFEHPIISWYPSGKIENICLKNNDKGVLAERYSEDGVVERRGYFYKGQFFNE
jgi:antitoxin component YwqK of YwqJK toxin-antitoxin module